MKNATAFLPRVGKPLGSVELNGMEYQLRRTERGLRWFAAAPEQREKYSADNDLIRVLPVRAPKVLRALRRDGKKLLAKVSA